MGFSAAGAFVLSALISMCMNITSVWPHYNASVALDDPLAAGSRLLNDVV